MKATVGDRIVLRGRGAGDAELDGEVLEVRGDFGEPPYLVRWSGANKAGWYFPGPNASIEHLGNDHEKVPPEQQIGAVMTRDVITVSPDVPFAELLRTMIDHEVGALPIIDEHGALIGIVSEADVLAHRAHSDRHRQPLQYIPTHSEGNELQPKLVSATAGDLMTTTVVTISPTDNLQMAARRMAQRGVKHLVVIDDGHIVGIVTRHDFLQTLADELHTRQPVA